MGRSNSKGLWWTNWTHEGTKISRPCSSWRSCCKECNKFNGQTCLFAWHYTANSTEKRRPPFCLHWQRQRFCWLQPLVSRWCSRYLEPATLYSFDLEAIFWINFLHLYNKQIFSTSIFLGFVHSYSTFGDQYSVHGFKFVKDWDSKLVHFILKRNWCNALRFFNNFKRVE